MTTTASKEGGSFAVIPQTEKIDNSNSTFSEIKVSPNRLNQQHHRLLWGNNNYFETFDSNSPLFRYAVVALTYEVQWFGFFDDWLRTKGITETKDIEDCHGQDKWIEYFEKVQNLTQYKWKPEHRARANLIIARGIGKYGSSYDDPKRMTNQVCMNSQEVKQWCQILYADYHKYVGENFYKRLFVGNGGLGWLAV